MTVYADSPNRAVAPTPTGLSSTLALEACNAEYTFRNMVVRAGRLVVRVSDHVDRKAVGRSAVRPA